MCVTFSPCQHPLLVWWWLNPELIFLAGPREWQAITVWQHVAVFSISGKKSGRVPGDKFGPVTLGNCFHYRLGGNYYILINNSFNNHQHWSFSGLRVGSESKEFTVQKWPIFENSKFTIKIFIFERKLEVPLPLLFWDKE